jgi:hypothetical protein
MCDQILMFIGGIATGIVFVCILGLIMMRKLK